MATGNNPEDNGIEQFNLTLGMEFDINPADIQRLAHALEQADAYNASEAASETLAEYAAALKHVEDAAEQARKDVFEDELDTRVDDGEDIGPLRKQTGRNTWVADTEAAFSAVSERGEDPMSVASVSISDLRDVLGAGADEYIDDAEYTYFRRL